jgi:hypothetical protein
MLKPEYGINIRSRFSFDKSQESLYELAFARLQQIPAPWGFKGVEFKPLPQMKQFPVAGVSYTRELGAPIKTFGMGFLNRLRSEAPRDDPTGDDTLTIDFNINHKSIDYNHLVREVLPAYVEAMGAYFMRLDDHNIAVADSTVIDEAGASHARPGYVDFREGVSRIWPANYWDRELCLRAFSLTPEQVVSRLNGRVASARILLDGALVIFSFERVPDDQIVAIDGKLRPLLRGR